MPIDRRSILSGSIVVGLTGAVAANPGPRSERETARVAAAEVPSAAELGLKPGAAQDQSAALQAAIDQTTNRGAPLLLPPGRFRTGGFCCSMVRICIGEVCVRSTCAPRAPSM